MSAIFLLPVCFTYWPRKYTTRVDPHDNNSHKVWSLPSYSVFVWWYVTWPWPLTFDLWPLTFDLWPFDLEQLTWIGVMCLTSLPSFKTIRSWVMSYNVFRWLPLNMRTRPLRMRRITWPVSRGSKTITFSECPTQICLFTIQFLLFRARFGDISRLQAEL